MPGIYRIREIKTCQDHYIEALEHSAHITSTVTGVRQPIDISLPDAVKKILDKLPVV